MLSVGVEPTTLTLEPCRAVQLRHESLQRAVRDLNSQDCVWSAAVCRINETAQSVQSEIRTHKAEAGTFTASGCHPSPLLHIGAPTESRTRTRCSQLLAKQGHCQLRYQGKERMTGVEPASLTWKARAPPLYHPQGAISESRPPRQAKRAGELASFGYETIALPAEL